MSIQPNGFTHHAVEATKHLWMVPYTITGTPDPDEGFAESIVKDADYARRNNDNESFWHFSVGAVAYAHIAANAIIRTLANHDNTDEVGELNAELIDEELEEANHQVTMAVAHWFKAADFHFQLGEVVHDASNVYDHPNGFDCTRNISQNVAWFFCAQHTERQSPCLNCPATRNLGTPVCRTELDRTTLRLSTGERQKLDLQRLGPLPAPEGAAAHCLKAIEQLAQLAGRFEVGSTNHRGIAYAALATSDAIGRLYHLEHYCDMDDDVLRIRADADRIAAGILSGEPIDEDQAFAPPGEYDECVIKRELTTGKVSYDCAPPDAPEGWDMDDLGHDDPCRLCPMKSSVPETAMDRMIQRLAELPVHA